jgi:amino acid transporter
MGRSIAVPSKAFFLLVGVGAFTLLERPERTLLLIALVAAGSVACMGRVLISKENAPKVEKLSAALLGFAIGGAAIYFMAQVGGVLGWTTLALVLLLDVVLVWALVHLGGFLGRPIARWRGRDERRPHEFGIVMILAVTLALAVSFTNGTDKLPGIALGSPLVLHLERAAAMLGVLLLVFTVLVYAWKGILPSEISPRGVSYADAKDKTEATLKALEDATRSSTKALRRTRQEVKELSKLVGKP